MENLSNQEILNLLKGQFVVFSTNINFASSDDDEIVNSFKNITDAAEYCREQNFRNHVCGSSEFLYYELQKN